MAAPERELSSGGVVAKLCNSEASGASDIQKISILLIKDPYGKWTWPKGKIDGDETPIDAAKREIGEETGLKNIRLITKIGDINYYYTRDKKLVYKTVYLFVFDFTGSEALSIQTSEIDDGRWFSEDEALVKVDYKGAKALLKKAIKAYKGYQRSEE